MKKICVLCVTYNRKDYLMNLLLSLQTQSYKIDSIIIVDNDSDDNTNEMLQKKGYIVDSDYNIVQQNIFDEVNFYYFRSSINMGGAGGFKKCFEIADTLNVDYYWVMDDDVLPEKDCLYKLVTNQSKTNQITIPSRNDKNFKDRIVTQIDMKSVLKGIASRKKYYMKDLDFNIEVVDMPFEGPLINANLARKIGLPNDKYFIYYDDTDYAWRANKYTNILYIHDAILHKQIIPIDSNSQDINWKKYYLIRNTIFFDRTYGENFSVRFIRPILIWLSLILKNIIKLNFKNIFKINKAFWDGYTGNIGKTVDPGSF